MVTRKYVKLKKKLEDERVRLTGEIEQLDTIREEGLDHGNEMADEATEVFEQTMNLALSHNLEHSLREVEDALRRLEEGFYGICEDCGRAIEEGRLRVLPYTSLCVQCAQRRERGA